MEWNDEGLVLSARPHGETAMIVTLLTEAHGCHAGLVQGGQSRTRRPILQIGAHVKARWSARLSDHLGQFTLEPMRALSTRWLNAPEVLAIIAASASIIEASLPERQPVPHIFASLMALFEIEEASLWPPAYVRWELGILEALGYGLDLSCCALTGETEDLAYVSPRTGRAASRTAGAPYAQKLLPVPAFLCGKGVCEESDVLMGLELTGHFLARHVFANPQSRRLVPTDGTLPAPRARLNDLFRSSPNHATPEAA